MSSNTVGLSNDTSWFLDISSYAADIDALAFGVSFSFLLDTNNSLPSSGTLGLQANLLDLSPPVDGATLIVGASTASLSLVYDSVAGYQSSSLFRDDLPMGSRSLQLNVGIDLGSGVANRQHPLDDFTVTFSTAPEPSTALLVLFGLAGLAERRGLRPSSGRFRARGG